MNQPPVRMFEVSDTDLSDLQWQRLAQGADNATQALPQQEAPGADLPTQAYQPVAETVAHEGPHSQAAESEGTFRAPQSSRLRRRLTILATALMLAGSVVLATAAASNQIPSGDRTDQVETGKGKKKGARALTAGEGSNGAVALSGSDAGNQSSSSGSGSAPAPTSSDSPSPTSTPTPTPTPTATPSGTLAPPSAPATPTEGPPAGTASPSLVQP